MKKKYLLVSLVFLLNIFGCYSMLEEKKIQPNINIEIETITNQSLLLDNNILLKEINISNKVAAFNITNQTIETETKTETKVVKMKSKKITKIKNNNKRNQKNTKNKWNYLGEFKITFYCSCSRCCGEYANGITATGESLQSFKTIAVDPNVIPYYSKIKIDGLDGYEFIATDTGGAIKGNKIDVYVSDHQTALNYGVMYTNVYKKGN